MRLTIERMRALVLVGGGLLIVALVAFLAVARWKARTFIKEIPQRLGIEIQQESNGVVIARNIGPHAQFKIHASKVVQLKEGGRAILHDVVIELFGDDGKRVDRIAGKEFEYDQKNGIAKATGVVEITLTRPSEALAGVSKALPGGSEKATPLSNAAKTASKGEIHVKTSGLVFDQKSGLATTSERVEFAITQGSGSSVGATFDSERGQLMLNQAVELDVRRGPEQVLLHARHAEFERDNLVCRMEGAEGIFRGGRATAGQADVRFRPDGSAERLDAGNGFSLATATSAHVAAPRAMLEFDEHNQPKRGRLEGGATLDSDSEGVKSNSNGMDSSGKRRQVHGSAPSADLAFTAEGLLRHAHLERGVAIHSDEAGTAKTGESIKVTRDWHSPLADVDFRAAGKGQVELASVTGSGGVTIASQTQRGSGPVMPSRMAADQVRATFGDRQEITDAVGTGHARLEQTTSAGAKQTTSGDRIQVEFRPTSERVSNDTQSGAVSPGGEQIQSATVEGNVVLVEQPAAKAGAAGPAPLRATAGRAVYEGAGEWLHLLVNPRVESGALQLTADKLDVSQRSGDAFAHGNVKATWTGQGADGVKAGGGSTGRQAFGGQGAAHVVAAEAQLNQATGEAWFRGQARLWQQANSISAPEIVLDRTRETLVARATSAKDPVRVVMLSAGGLNGSSRPRALSANQPGHKDPSPGTAGSAERPGHGVDGGTPVSASVLRVRGGELKYSEAERKAWMHADAGGTVVAETATATVTSTDLELVLLAPGNHAAPDGGAAQVDRITALGRVTIASQGRRGTGERLVYSSETDEYVLTGSASNPPMLTDPAKGTVSGTSLIFNTRDDSVSIEGSGRKTSTETVAPK